MELSHAFCISTEQQRERIGKSKRIKSLRYQFSLRWWRKKLSSCTKLVLDSFATFSNSQFPLFFFMRQYFMYASSSHNSDMRILHRTKKFEPFHEIRRKVHTTQNSQHQQQSTAVKKKVLKIFPVVLQLNFLSLESATLLILVNALPIYSEKADLKPRHDNSHIGVPHLDAIYTTPTGFHHPHHPHANGIHHGSPEAMKVRMAAMVLSPPTRV